MSQLLNLAHLDMSARTTNSRDPSKDCSRLLFKQGRRDCRRPQEDSRTHVGGARALMTFYRQPAFSCWIMSVRLSGIANGRADGHAGYRVTDVNGHSWAVVDPDRFQVCAGNTFHLSHFEHFDSLATLAIPDRVPCSTPAALLALARVDGVAVRAIASLLLPSLPQCLAGLFFCIGLANVRHHLIACIDPVWLSNVRVGLSLRPSISSPFADVRLRTQLTVAASEAASIANTA